MNRKLLVVALGIAAIAVCQERRNAKARRRTRELWERATAE